MSGFLRSLRGVVPGSIAVKPAGEQPFAADGNVSGVLAASPDIRRIYRSVADQVFAGDKLKGRRSVMVCGTEGGEGATTAAIHIAAALAEGGHDVVVIDASGRTPALGRMLGQDAAGVLDLFHGSRAVDDVFHATDQEKLTLVPFGPPEENLSGVLTSDAFAGLVAAARKRFDVVLFDGSPIHPLGESLLLRPHVDAAMLIVRADGTDVDLLTRAKEMLGASNIPLLGVILNRRRYPIPGWLYRLLFAS